MNGEFKMYNRNVTGYTKCECECTKLSGNIYLVWLLKLPKSLHAFNVEYLLGFKDEKTAQNN